MNETMIHVYVFTRPATKLEAAVLNVDTVYEAVTEKGDVEDGKLIEEFDCPQYIFDEFFKDDAAVKNFVKTGEHTLKTDELEEDFVAHTLEIKIKAVMTRYADTAEFNYETPAISVDDASVIKIIPSSTEVSFVSAEKIDSVPNEHIDESDNEHTVYISLIANVELEDTNSVDYSVEVTNIGEIAIKLMVSEGSAKFISLAENNIVEEPVSSQEPVIYAVEDAAYSYDEVEADLRVLTKNWTTSDTLKSGYPEEHNYAMEILRNHYETVNDEGKSGDWYYVSFSGSRLTEDFHPDVDTHDIVGRFMTGDITIDKLPNEPEESTSIIRLKDLEGIGNDYKYFYDTESDVVGYYPCEVHEDELNA